MTFSRGNNRASKLNPGDVVEIRRRYEVDHWTQGQLARHYKVSLGQIGRIVRRESWNRLPEEPTDKDIEASMERLQSLLQKAPETQLNKLKEPKDA